MGMPKGSRWKRLAIFSDEINGDSAPRVAEVLRASSIEIEWWQRSVARGKGKLSSRNQINNLGRDEHPLSEEWLMVRRGDWPMAYIIARDLGVSL